MALDGYVFEYSLLKPTTFHSEGCTPLDAEEGERGITVCGNERR